MRKIHLGFQVYTHTRIHTNLWYWRNLKSEKNSMQWCTVITAQWALHFFFIVLFCLMKCQCEPEIENRWWVPFWEPRPVICNAYEVILSLEYIYKSTVRFIWKRARHAIISKRIEGRKKKRKSYTESMEIF